MENQVSNPQDTQPKKDDKTPAVVSYLGPVGWIIAYVMYSSNKTEFNTFHLRQAFGASAIAVVGYFVAFIVSIVFAVVHLYFIGELVYYAVYIIAAIFYIMGLINSAGGQKKYLPILGEKFETMFAGFVK
jgi:uncharacterized membrane protein